jgi:hypothetical protein
MAWFRRHALPLAVALVLLAAGVWLALAEHNPGIGWMLIVWALAVVAGCAAPGSAARARARRGRSGSRSG